MQDQKGYIHLHLQPQDSTDYSGIRAFLNLFITVNCFIRVNYFVLLVLIVSLKKSLFKNTIFTPLNITRVTKHVRGFALSCWKTKHSQFANSGRFSCTASLS